MIGGPGIGNQLVAAIARHGYLCLRDDRPQTVHEHIRPGGDFVTLERLRVLPFALRVQLGKHLLDLHVVRRPHPRGNLMRIGGGGKRDVGEFLLEESQNLARSERFERVNPRLRCVFRIFLLVERFQGRRHRLMFGASCPRNDLARLGAGADSGLRRRLQQEGDRGSRRHALHRIDPHRHVALFLLDLLDGRGELPMVGGGRTDGQLVGVGPVVDLRAGRDLLEQVIGLMDGGLLEGIDPDLRARSLFVEFIERVLDLLLFFGAGDDDQLVDRRAAAELDVRKGRRQDGNRLTHRDAFERVDDHLFGHLLLDETRH